MFIFKNKIYIYPLSTRALFILSLMIICCLFSEILNAQKRIPYESRYYSVTDGLPDQIVYSCMQDSRKYMWFFTPAGASRFDGRRFENFTIADNMADNEIFGGFEDSQGRIWFRSLNGKLSYFNIKTNKISSFRDNTILSKIAMKSLISAIYENKNQGIIIQSNNGIAVLSDTSIKFTKGGQGFGLIRDKYKNIYIASVDISQFDDSTINKKHLIKVNAINYHCVISDSTFFISLTEGVFTYKLGDKSIKPFFPASKYNNKYIKSLSVDNDKNLWLGTFDGVYRVNIDNVEDVSFTFTGSHVSSVFKDHENNYWITTLGNGIMLQPKAFNKVKLLNKVNGLAENEVTVVKRHENGTLVFGVKPNTIYAIKNNKLYKTVIDTADQLKINKLEFINNDLWYITQNTSTFHIENYFNSPPKRFKMAGLNLKPLASDAIPKTVNTAYIHRYITVIKNIYQASDKSIYLLNWNLLRLTALKNGFFNINEKEITRLSRHYAIAESKKGLIWFGGIDGIGSYDPITDNIKKLNNLQFESTANDIIVLEENILLISTFGGGIYLVKDEKIVKHWDELSGLSSNVCNKMFKQSENSIWIATGKGVTHMAFKNMDYTNPEFTLYGGKNNNPATYVNDLLLNNDTLVLATNDGLYQFNINEMTPQYNSPILRIISPDYYIDNHSLTYKLPYSFFKNTNQINFQFQTISFMNGDDIKYSYQLFLNNKQLQSDSFLLKDKFILPLSSLTSGTYKIIVKAKRNDGIESVPMELNFEINPPIFQNTISILFYSLLFAVLIYYILRYFNRQKTKRRELTMAQKEETMQLEKQAIDANKQKLILEQESLRARIDPHFIFNCLNNMMLFVYEKDFKNLKNYLPQLARLIRSSLQLAKEDFINLNTEKNYLEDYLNLEKMRFEEKFEYSIQIDKNVDTERKIIPPLMLQIFIENAIKHGFNDFKTNEKGIISVRFFNENNTLICVVEDNGIGISENTHNSAQTLHKSMGLEIVRKRISILNELKNAGLQLNIKNKTGENGTIATLKIDF